MLGIRLSFEAAEADEMRAEFSKAFPKDSTKFLSNNLALEKICLATQLFPT